MAEAPQSNVDRLQDAGLITTTSLPDQYGEVVEGLSEDEVRLLVSLKERLDKAEASHRMEAQADAQLVTECFVPL